ncbi:MULTISPECIES: hypothetical protein [unclassified Streptomyces]|uniref:hypothetical protein n=1 Tax=unclassified Streptomyces TaxID=2593676 RepID=UPI00081F0BB3|nr:MULTISPECIES: hypothetical protein [unclassified Streptomyces]MYR29804.1 hypothetical protein [Streptomyces sp. SID4945]SCF47706.1 hypothetical protein GA0115257_119113 [Streptomyces sp. LcepLS]
MAVLSPLVTVAELAALLGRTFTPAQEQQAQALLDQASSVVRAYVRQDLTRATTTDTFTMRRADRVLHRCGGLVTLPQRPVVNIAAVEVAGVPTGDWWQEGQDLLLGHWGWDSPPAAHRPPQVAVTYTHGFDPVPGDIAAIVAQAATRVMVNPSAVRSETVGGESVTYLIPATGEALGVLLSRTEQRVLDRYRRTSGTVRLRGA